MQFKKGSPYRQMFSGKQCSGGTPPSFIRDAVSRVGDGFLQEHWVHSSGYADQHLWQALNSPCSAKAATDNTHK